MLFGFCPCPCINVEVMGPTNLDYSRARACCAGSRCGWGLFGHFFSHLSFLSSFSLFWETARYRLKYCLKGPLNPKQPTNQVMARTSSIYDHFIILSSSMTLTIHIPDQMIQMALFQTVLNNFEIHAQMYKIWPGQIWMDTHTHTCTTQACTHACKGIHETEVATTMSGTSSYK